MILKKIFNPLSVARYMRWELTISTILSVAVYFLYHNQHLEKVSLPFSIAAILGSAIAGGKPVRFGAASSTTAAFLPAKSLPMPIVLCRVARQMLTKYKHTKKKCCIVKLPLLTLCACI